MTKIEIINETAAFYNKDKRAYDSEIASCEYLTFGGQNCAVGRCINPNVIETFQMDYESTGVNRIGHDNLERALKDEYKGHSIEFWDHLQTFHDMSTHWTDTGLSDLGKRYYDMLLTKFEGQ